MAYFRAIIKIDMYVPYVNLTLFYRFASQTEQTGSTTYMSFISQRAPSAKNHDHEPVPEPERDDNRMMRIAAKRNSSRNRS